VKDVEVVEDIDVLDMKSINRSKRDDDVCGIKIGGTFAFFGVITPNKQCVKITSFYSHL